MAASQSVRRGVFSYAVGRPKDKMGPKPRLLHTGVSASVHGSELDPAVLHALFLGVVIGHRPVLAVQLLVGCRAAGAVLMAADLARQATGEPNLSGQRRCAERRREPDRRSGKQCHLAAGAGDRVGIPPVTVGAGSQAPSAEEYRTQFVKEAARPAWSGQLSAGRCPNSLIPIEFRFCPPQARQGRPK